MHELSIAAAAYRISRATADAHGAARLEVVRMAVGEISSVEPSLLVSAWEAVTADGPDAGSRLDVAFMPARQVCASCGEAPRRQPGSWMRLCPRCDLPLRIEGGDELHVLEVTMKVDDV